MIEVVHEDRLLDTMVLLLKIHLCFVGLMELSVQTDQKAPREISLQHLRRFVE